MKKSATKIKRANPKTSRNPNKHIPLYLLLCFPMGLLRMWRKECTWHLAVKIIASTLVAAAVVCVVLPITQPPERYTGGVLLQTNEDTIIGPKPTENFSRIELYSYNVTNDSVIAEPEPTPVPIYVYCNDGGKFYHNKECSYVKSTSGRFSLLQALNAGYKRCTECNAPAEY